MLHSIYKSTGNGSDYMVFARARTACKALAVDVTTHTLYISTDRFLPNPRSSGIMLRILGQAILPLLKLFWVIVNPLTKMRYATC